MKRINVFEQWCYRVMLKISWKDNVANTAEVLKRIGEKEQQFFRKIVHWRKMLNMCLLFRGSSERNALVIY